jgi:predicted house-cleaning noncanonical NTP pyrophosphatase (MazG superfamily)
MDFAWILPDLAASLRHCSTVPAMRTDYNKLVRDRIPEIITAEGKQPRTRILDEHEYRPALLAKLLEEAHEASRAPSCEELAGELADVLEVVRALAAEIRVTWEELLELAADKRRSRGAFSQRIFLECVEHE